MRRHRQEFTVAQAPWPLRAPNPGHTTSRRLHCCTQRILLSLSLPFFRSRCRTLSPSHFRGNSLTSDDCQSRPCITARRSLLCICIFSCFSLCLVFRPHKKKKKKWRVLRRHPTKKGNSSFCCVLKPDEKKYYTEGERKKKKTEQFIFI